MSIALVLIGAALPLAAGAFVVHRHPRHPIGWLLVVHGAGFATVLGIGGPHDEGAGLVADQLLAGAWVFLFGATATAVYLVPDGRPATLRWRRWLTACLIGVVFLLVGAPGDRTGFIEIHDGTRPPVPWLPEALSAVIGVTGLLGVVCLLFGAVVSVWTRLTASTGVVRQQLLWVVAGAIPIPVAVLIGWIDHFLADGGLSGLFDAALVMASVSLPVAIAIAIVRHQLFDIRVVLSQTLTYLALAVFVGAVYGATWASSKAIVDSEASGGIVAVALVALIAHPVAVAVHRRVERWVHGYGSTPYLAVQRVAIRSSDSDADELLATVLTSTAEVVGADRVRVEHTGPEGDAVRVPLTAGSESLGVLAVEMPPDRSGTLDHALLEDISRYVALVVRSDRLNHELRTSRDRLVALREEERRRLHRELHDGLGPTLAAMVLKLDVARRRATGATRDDLLAEIRLDAQCAVDEIRRVVDDLRPSMLEHVGLIGALRALGRSLSTDSTTFYVDGAESTPHLPPHIEDAAYRIASEAMTNAAKHANARHCLVEVTAGSKVSISVGAVASNTSPQSTPGAGWRTMTERAAELGGSLAIGAGPSGGFEVRATLPVAATQRHDEVPRS